jgi:hypothetical protein
MTLHLHAAALLGDMSPHTTAFFRQVLVTLTQAGIAFAVGGAFAQACLTGILRPTRDLDLFMRRADWDRARAVAQVAGWRAELTYPHWLAKLHAGRDFVDLIFNSGNGLAPVDDRWFSGNLEADLLGSRVRIAKAEDSLLSKAFIMERERFDGADVAHLLQAQADRVDWTSLVDRFGPHWRVLLAHLTLFGFIYPDERARVPAWVVRELAGRLDREAEADAAAPEHPRVCAGTLISRAQYLEDVQCRGYLDARLLPGGSMRPEDVAAWTQAISAQRPGGG